MGRESQATTVVGVESSDHHLASPFGTSPEVRVERIGSQVVANTMGRVAMLASNVDDGSLRDAPVEVFMADGDTESARSEDVAAHHAEHDVIQEGPVSSDSESDQEISDSRR